MTQQTFDEMVTFAVDVFSFNDTTELHTFFCQLADNHNLFFDQAIIYHDQSKFNPSNQTKLFKDN